jgi:hypothetical protein
VSFCAVRTRPISDPVTFTIAVQARVLAANCDRVVPQESLMRAVPLAASLDAASLPPSFFHTVNRIRAARLRGAVS